MPKHKTAMELAIALAEETANHLHDRQDYDRIKDMAREVLKAAGKEAKPSYGSVMLSATSRFRVSSWRRTRTRSRISTG